jgi:hypothetical membrane protein
MTTITCDPATATTRSLLGWGAVAGPFFVLVSLAQALTRDGFDLTRHPWSVLENGPLGWIQSANFVLTGLMVVAFAAGLRRTVGGRAPVLLGVYGLSLALAGVFTADPVDGFPRGAVATVSWHGLAHLAAGGIGFLCMAAACLMLARRFRGGRVVGVGFLVAFAGISSGSPAATIPFVLAVVGSFGWLAALAVRTYRTV